MPWDIKGVMTLKNDFVLKVKEGLGNISQLCREYGISRQMDAKGLMLKQGTLIDATVIEAAPTPVPIKMEQEADRLKTLMSIG